MAKTPKVMIAKCPKCQKPVWDDHEYPWCIECGEQFPEDFTPNIPKLQKATTGSRASRQLCPNCGKEISANASRCKHCLQEISPNPSDFRASTADTQDRANSGIHLSEPLTPAQHSAVLALRATKRYADAYAVASSVDAQGRLLKGLAVVFAVVIGLMTLIAATRIEGKIAMALLVNGAIVAALVWSIVHGLGVRIAAEGQHLLASLDIAVHTSPFMSDAQRAQAMSL